MIDPADDLVDTDYLLPPELLFILWRNAVVRPWASEEPEAYYESVLSIALAMREAEAVDIGVSRTET